MSINVTVSGNPVSIKNGRMCISDPDYAKKEFEKRRLMRLEQVRQQSRGIAEDIRNKVRREKQKQISEIEREGKEKLKNWQNRKLLELQNQCKEDISDVSTSAFKEAEQFAGESDIWSERRKENAKVAKKRGTEAAQRLQVEKNEKNYEKAKPIQQKRMAREMENNRAAAVSKKANKCRESCPVVMKKQKKQPTTDINISIPQAVPFESEKSDEFEEFDESSSAGGNEDSQDDEIDDCFNNDAIEIEDSSEDDGEAEIRRPLTTIDENESQGWTKGQKSTCPGYSKSSTSQHFDAATTTEERAKYHVGDTRISDRIRRRKYMASQPDFCDIAADIEPLPIVEPHKKYHEFYYNRQQKPPPTCFSNFSSDNEFVKERDKENTDKVDKSAQVSSKNRRKVPSKTQIDPQKNLATKSPSKFKTNRKIEVNPQEIPFRDAVKLKETASQPSVQLTLSESVPYYDRANKYSGKMADLPSAVEKISRDSIEVIPNSLSEAEEIARMRIRDQEAKLRGQRALEKERVHRDYKELMKKLPLLRKQERINEIKQTDKPEYHMDEARLKEKERKRQNAMENRYAQLFPEKKPAIVTLPTNSDNLPTNQNVQSNSQNLPSQKNAANWDVDFAASNIFSPEEVEQIASAMSQETSKDRQQKLKELLKSLKNQKRQLIKEIRSLPEDDSLVKVLNEMESKRKVKRKRTTTDYSSSPESTCSESVKHRSKKSDKVTSVSKTKVLILQNTSTQTTPKPQQLNEDKNVQTSLITADKACSKLHIPCTCTSPKKEKVSVECQAKETDEEVCKIVIKINDDAQEVKVVKPSGTPMETAKFDEKKISWREEFTKNTSSNSSTTYYSPPDFQSLQSLKNVAKKSIFEKQRQENRYFTSSTIESNKFSTTPAEIDGDVKVTKAIKKLLTMSRNSIDNLTVSSSEVPTPSQSVVEIETNNPAGKLNDIIKQFNSAVQDAAKELSMSPEFSRISNFSNSNKSSKIYLSDKISLSNKSSKIDSASKSRFDPDTPVSNQFVDTTDSCSRRIAKLAEMIQKLRREKAEILNSATSSSSFSNSSISDKEKTGFDTAYLDLPEHVEQLTSSKESSSMEDTDLKRELLDIDFSLANRLRKYPEKAPTQEQPKPDFDLPPTKPEDILIGLKNLLDSKESDEAIENMLSKGFETASKKKIILDSPPKKSSPKISSPKKSSPNKSSPKKSSPKKSSPKKQPLKESDINDEEKEEFVPMLMNIPKLPVFEVNCEDPISANGNKKPPPCKGCRKLNGELLLIPHELSTIVEIDSQLSTKAPTPNVTPKASKTQPPTAPQASPVSEKSSSLKESSSSSTNDNNSKKKSSSKSLIKQLTESSSSDDIENFESMLHNMGMDWAVSTLHKTREALALTSSSSSLELSARHPRSKLESSTEVSLKELLKQRGKFSSSTLNNTDTIASFDVSELSVIVDKTTQRTSTPVLQGQSVAFTSDLSSVKNDSSKSSSKSA